MIFCESGALQSKSTNSRRKQSSERRLANWARRGMNFERASTNMMMKYWRSCGRRACSGVVPGPRAPSHFISLLLSCACSLLERAAGLGSAHTAPLGAHSLSQEQICMDAAAVPTGATAHSCALRRHVCSVLYSLKCSCLVQQSINQDCLLNRGLIRFAQICTQQWILYSLPHCDRLKQKVDFLAMIKLEWVWIVFFIIKINCLRKEIFEICFF